MRSPLCDVVVLCDLDRELASARAKQFGIPEVETDYQRLLSRIDIDVIDIGMMSVRSDLDRVVGTLKNMLPYRRRTNLDTERERINVDDADIFIGECANGALLSIQSSYVTVGNYPGIEARIYGSEGALICRLVEEFGECETLSGATPDAVEFVPMTIPREFFPPGAQPGEPWPSLFYGNLVHNFMEELVDGGHENQGNFGQSAKVQEVINAVALSHRDRRWVDLPLETMD